MDRGFVPNKRLLLHVATANVNTLRPKYDNDVQSERGVAVAARTQILEVLFSEAGLDLVGIQEGRAKVDGSRSGVCYDMVIAGATPMGSYGNQLWIHSHLRYKLQATIVHSPTLLQVDMVINDAYEVAAFVGHAPHEHDSADNKCAFWTLLLAVTLRSRDIKPNAHVVLLIDANARVGSVVSPQLGPCASQAENNNGECFRIYLEATALSAGNTFHDAGDTWVITFGMSHRIDYIVSSVDPAREVD